ncbi:conserved hypothetical protein [Ricinus communis]|uniref:Uncharacterized protein n=1 Tax=Ricinus communis TaxID=3988 RepID=B9SDS6_RICCO|nr:conserved hypothetical protein [Ricinus communis]
MSSLDLFQSISEIAAIWPLNAELSPDKVTWNFSKNDDFMNRSAFDLISKNQDCRVN